MLSIRLLLSILGTDTYSIFALLSGLLAFATLIDLGIGNSLHNFIAENKVKGRDNSEILTTTLYISIIIGMTTLLLGLVSASTVGSIYLQSSNTLSEEQKKSILLIAIIIFTFTSLGSIGYKIWFAKHLGWIANIFAAIGPAAGYLGIYYYFKIANHAPSLTAAFILFYAPSALLAIAALIFTCTNSIASLTWKSFRDTTALLMRRSIKFWVLAILYALTLQTDLLVISQRSSASDIIIYSVLLKIFSLAFMMYSVMLQALWPVCAEHIARNDWIKIRTTSRQYIVLGTAGMILFIIIFLAFENMIMKFIGVKEEIPTMTAILFGVYFIVRVWADTFSMLFQSMNKLKPLWISISLQAIISIGLQWWLSGLIGINGILIGITTSYLVTQCLFLPKTLNKEISRQIKLC